MLATRHHTYAHVIGVWFTVFPVAISGWITIQPVAVIRIIRFRLVKPDPAAAGRSITSNNIPVCQVIGFSSCVSPGVANHLVG